MATQDEINKIRNTIINVEIDDYVAAATFNIIKQAVVAAGSATQNAITIGVNTRDSKKIGDAITSAVEEYGRSGAEATADAILADELLTVDEIFKYK